MAETKINELDAQADVAAGDYFVVDVDSGGAVFTTKKYDASSIADAVSKKHTQDTDTNLGTLGTKNPPIDADKAVYRDSTASDALVTSTWAQIKAFLKTYFDTLYNNYTLETHASNHTDGTDNIQSATNAQKGLATAAHITAIEANTSASHTQGTDTKLDEGGPNEITAAELTTLRDTTVPAKADKDTDAVVGNLAQFDANGNPIDSTIPAINIIRSKILMDDVYGLEWHKASNSFTRLFDAEGKTAGTDFDSFRPFMNMQRCNIANDGTVNDYHGDVSFAYDGTNGQVMVELEGFYYQMYRTNSGAIFCVSPWGNPGFKKYPAFIRNGEYLDYIYPSAFEGSYDTVNSMMRSIANVVPSTSDGTSDGGLSPVAAYPATTAGVEGIDTNGGDIRNCRYWAQARGANWEQYDFLTHNALCMLAFIEYGTFDLQTAIGKGVVDKASGSNNNAELTGQTAGYAGGTDLGNASGQIATNGLKSMSYRGVENLYGNIWKWVDGLNIKADNDPYVADHGFESDKFTDPYIHLQATLPASNGYGGDILINDAIDYGFLTSALGGANNSGLFDYYYQNTGNRVARVGNGWYGGLGGGPLYWALYISSAGVRRVVGARPLHLPAPYVRS